MSNKHASGPWHVGTECIKNQLVVCPLEDSPLIITIEQVDGDLQELEANARLVAAAPEMLGALETVLRNFAPCGVEGLTAKQSLSIGQAMNAVAKAKGETK